MAYKVFKKVNNGLVQTEYLLMLLLVITCVVVTIMMIVWRYILHLTLAWAEEVCRMCLVGAIWLAIPQLVSDYDHIVINIIDSLVDKTKDPKKVAFIMKVIDSIIILIFLGFMIRIYGDYVFNDLYGKPIRTQALRLPMWVPLTTPFIGLILSEIQGIFGLVKTCVEYREDLNKEQDAGEGIEK